MTENATEIASLLIKNIDNLIRRDAVLEKKNINVIMWLIIIIGTYVGILMYYTTS